MPDRRDLRAIDRMFADHIVDAGHHVLTVLRAPRAPRAPQELLTVARRAAEVHLKHEVAVRREVLILEIEAVTVRAVRPTVVADDERVARVAGRAGPIAVWIQQPPLD